MPNKSNVQRLRELMEAYGLTRPQVRDICRSAGYELPKSTLDSYLSAVGASCHRASLPTHIVEVVKDWCKKHGKRKKG